MRPNQVQATDITYVPMARGLVYLAAVVDWFSRRVLAWRVSITLAADFCVETLREVLARHGRQGIFNTDPGLAGHPQQLRQGAQGRPHCHQHGRPERVARQRLRRAPLAHGEVRGGLPARPTGPSARRGPRSGATSASTTPRGRIRRSAGRRPTRPTSTGRRQSRRRRTQGGDPLTSNPEAVQTKPSHLSPRWPDRTSGALPRRRR